ncbi:MAG: flagellar type III secretion system pore protein FliP [Clostridia bacterium]|nr:flagellar type III secretion system pore protein FliP [Clostridia bacterium]MDD4047614.1 flagellar type III secretion system pore protein FliP [Clostridia bacterium]
MLFISIDVYAIPLTIPKIGLEVGSSDSPQDVALTLQIMALLTILTLAPAILILMTSFTRIIVVFSFLRNALATQQMPPNQVLVGLALFLTFFTMAPVWTDINQNALEPYFAGEIKQEEAFKNAVTPLRDFMLRQTRESDLALFVNLSKMPKPDNPEDIPTYVVIPAFAISELKTAFQIGFIIYVPFIVIDMVVASTLMSMGMMMLPPMMISLPFKLLLFVLVDGWHLVVQTLIMGFR